MAPQPVNEKPSLPENVLRSVEEARTLSSSLSAFISAWDGIHRSINSINASLDILDGGGNKKASEASKDLGKVKSEGSAGKVAEAAQGKKTVETVGAVGEGAAVNAESLDIEVICTTTIGKNLRKYINTNKNINPEEFRSKTASALSSAVNPEKLVINCLGGIYLQGKRAFSDPKSNAVAHLQDSIIAFELLLESGKVGPEEELEESLKAEASEVSVKWRKRLVVFEGGIADSNDGDIIGLSLFLSCFGFPSVFKCHELYQMLHLCDLRQKTKFLKLSPILLAKLPGKNPFFVSVWDLRSNDN